MTGLLGGAFRLVLIESWRLWGAVLLWARDLGGWHPAAPAWWGGSGCRPGLAD